MAIPHHTFRSACILVAAVLHLSISSANADDLVYVVRRGDTLSRIATRFGADMQSLARHNNIRRMGKLSIGQQLRIPNRADEKIRYIVEPGDTVEAIANDYGTSTEAIAAINGLAHPDRIRIGQKLWVPLVHPVPPAPAAVRPKTAAASPAPRHAVTTLNGALAQRISRARVIPDRWRYIVIHHSGSAVDTTWGMDRYHREGRRMKNGLAYHFVIGNGVRMPDGRIDIGARWTRQLAGGHLANDRQNAISIGICLVGNFDKRAPTTAQMKSLRSLVAHLMDQCELGPGALHTHQQINTKPTACPGRYFPIGSLVRDLRNTTHPRVAKN